MIYCFDLDDTLCKADNDHAKAKPYRERITKVNQLYDQGHTIIIETARGSMTGKDWHEFTEKQLKKWGVKYHQLRTGVKIHADFYIDDRAYHVENFF